MSVGVEPDAWSKFWQEFCPENERNEACYVPGDGRSALDRQWAYFANSLPRGAHVIDIGCGAGIVGRNLLSQRPDLQITGVDCASVPVRSQAHLTIHTQVNMEALPFGDCSFDAAVSQFGIEYGNIVDAAPELERVLKPGAPLCFLIHHRDSEIVREGSLRRRALEELMRGKVKDAFLEGDAAGIDQLKQPLGKKFPDEPMVKLVSDYFLRNIGRPREERQEVWQKLSDELDPEIWLLLQLERSAKSAAELDSWLVPLQSAMTSVGTSIVQRGSGEPIAWSVHGMR